jgi:hypothetical protein
MRGLPIGLTLSLKSWVWVAAAIVGLILVFGIGRGLGFRWDPLGLERRRLDAALVQADLARRDAGARALEVQGQVKQARRIENVHQQSLAVSRITATAVTEARSAPDAHQSLDPARAARLSAHDDGLCRLSPGLCAAAAADGPGAGHDPLSVGPAG